MKSLGNESSSERKVQERKFPGTKGPGNESSRERKVSGTKVPLGTIRFWERKVLGTKSPGTLNHTVSPASKAFNESGLRHLMSLALPQRNNICVYHCEMCD